MPGVFGIAGPVTLARHIGCNLCLVEVAISIDTGMQASRVGPLQRASLMRAVAMAGISWAFLTTWPSTPATPELPEDLSLHLGFVVMDARCPVVVAQ